MLRIMSQQTRVSKDTDRNQAQPTLRNTIGRDEGRMLDKSRCESKALPLGQDSGPRSSLSSSPDEMEIIPPSRGKHGVH